MLLFQSPSWYSWLPSLIIPIVVGLVMIWLNKLTTKNNAEIAINFKVLEKRLGEVEKDSWTTSEKVALESRLVRFEERQVRLIQEVDFTKTSHTEFLRLLEKALIPVAHSPHTPELDRLLDKRDQGQELTSDEWEELIRR